MFSKPLRKIKTSGKKRPIQRSAQWCTAASQWLDARLLPRQLTALQTAWGEVWRLMKEAG